MPTKYAINGNSVVVETENFIVHVREEHGEMKVFAHLRRSDGKEALPLAYILGYNSLIFKPHNK